MIGKQPKKEAVVDHLIFIRHAKEVLDGILDKESIAFVRGIFEDERRRFISLSGDKVRILTSPQIRAKLTGDIMGEVFGVPVESFDSLDAGHPGSVLPDFFRKEGEGFDLLIAVSHAPEVAAFPKHLPCGFSFLDSKCLYERSYYDNGKGIIVDFNAKTVDVFPRQ